MVAVKQGKKRSQVSQLVKLKLSCYCEVVLRIGMVFYLELFNYCFSYVLPQAGRYLPTCSYLTLITHLNKASTHA